MGEYIKFDCPECGAPLEVYYKGPIEEYPGKPWDFVLGDCREVIRHCSKCHCDWINQWCDVLGCVFESKLERKFWG